MKRIIFTLLILPTVLTSEAQESFDVDGVTYVTTSSTTVSATGGASTLTSLVMPETVTYGGKTYTVTDIGDNAFSDCPLTEVTLPSTLLTFGREPFNGSNGLIITLHAVQAPVSTGWGRIASESEKCTLRVPAIAFEEYYDKWFYNRWGTNNFFGAIDYIDYEPETVYVHSDFSFTRVPNTTPDLQLLISPNAGRLTVDKAMSFGSFSQQINLNADNYERGFSSIICKDKVTAQSVELSATLRKSRWNFVVFPFDVKVSDITTNSKYPTYFRTYDGDARASYRMNETWVDVPANGMLQAYQGYIIYNRADDLADNEDLIANIQATGNISNIFLARDVNIPVSQYPSEFAQDCNWNLIGNPYPCFYDLRILSITNPITIYEYGRYYTFSPLDDAYVLCPFQAFFIQVENGVSSLDFLQEGRSHSSSGNSYARQIQLNRAKAARNREVLNILLESNQTDFTDRTRIVINEEAKADYEISRDATKFFASDNSLQQIYTIADGTAYAINERPKGDGVASIGMTIAQSGEYTLKMQTTSELPITLVDHETGISQPFNAGDTYTFSAMPGAISDRFTLLMGYATGIYQATSEMSNEKSQPVYNLSGQKVSADYKGIVIRNGKKNINK
ncbi:MAG: hypothetical protein IKY01_13500 [Prevotella sp.]|nr:hypothetical protein [Prevotella sp.]